MKRTSNSNNLTLCNIYRSQEDSSFTSPQRKKPRVMETSTPKNYKNQHRGDDKELMLSPIETSPIKTGSLEDHSCGSGDGVIRVRSPTQVSGGLEVLNITPPTKVSDSQEERDMASKVHMLTWAAVSRGIIVRSASLPNLIASTSMISIFRPYPSRVKDESVIRLRSNSLGARPSINADSIDYTQWSSNDFNLDYITNGNEVRALENGIKTLAIAGVNVNNPEVVRVEETIAGPEGGSVTDSAAMPGGDVNNSPVTGDENVMAGGDSITDSIAMPGENVNSPVSVVELPESTSILEATSCPELADAGGASVSDGVVLPGENVNSPEVVVELPKTPALNNGSLGKASALILGRDATEEMLLQPATPGSQSIKRILGDSTDRKWWKQRRLSFGGREFCQDEKDTPRTPSSTPRRNTWTSPRTSTGGRRKCRAKRGKDIRGQLLIDQMFGKECIEGENGPKVSENEGSFQGDGSPR